MQTSRAHCMLLTLAGAVLAGVGAPARSQASAPASSASASPSTAANATRATAKKKPPAPVPAGMGQRMDLLRQQVGVQGERIDALQKQLAEQETRYRELQERLNAQETRTAGATPPAPAVPAKAPMPGVPAAAAASAQPGAEEAADTGTRQVRVGVAPPAEQQPPPVAQLFEEPSILTPQGHFVIEPSFQYGYSSNNQLALVGYTIIPAILIGLVDVRQYKNNTMLAAITGRWGVTSKLELEAKVPYAYLSNNTISREIFTGSAQDNVFNAKGKGIGDVEVAARYQLFSAKEDWPYLVGSLRFKSRTGSDPFSVVTDCQQRCVGNATGTGLPLDLPTGSGFYSLQPGLTWLMPADPAVFFGGINYTYNFGRSNVYRNVLNGQQEYLGSIKPGGIWGINFGMGLGLNERSSYSLGFELYSVGATKQNGAVVAGSVRTQLASLLLGYSYRFSSRYTLNVSVGAGLTRDTPDLTVTVRLPISF